MDLLQLKYFCHAASTQNFSKTAREFLVPTSNISQCIKRLESELGVTLFIRSANRLQLSPQGELFYKGVQKTLNLLDTTIFSVQSSASTETIHIAICRLRQSVVRIMEGFQAKYPGVQITYERPPMPAMGFSTDGYDIIVADENITDPAFEREPISHPKCALIAPKGFLPKGEITPELLAQQTFVSLPPGSYMYRNTQDFFRELNIAPPILTEERHSIHFVPRCIEERQGIAFASPTTRWVAHMIEFLDIYDIGHIYSDVYIYRRKTSTSPYVISLYDSIRDHYKIKANTAGKLYRGDAKKTPAQNKL